MKLDIKYRWDGNVSRAAYSRFKSLFRGIKIEKIIPLLEERGWNEFCRWTNDIFENVAYQKRDGTETYEIHLSQTVPFDELSECDKYHMIEEIISFVLIENLDFDKTLDKLR